MEVNSMDELETLIRHNIAECIRLRDDVQANKWEGLLKSFLIYKSVGLEFPKLDDFNDSTLESEKGAICL